MYNGDSVHISVYLYLIYTIKNGQKDNTGSNNI